MAPAVAPAPLPAEDVAAAKRLLDTLAAVPRPAGGAAEAAARATCGARLAAAGFTVREEAFAYSAFPGRWATPLAGVVLLATLAGGGHLSYHGQPRGALALLVAGMLAIATLAAWGARRGVLDAPLLRRTGINLVATRDVAMPRVWLVAHVDSKSQPVPIALRAAGIVLGAAAWLALAALALLSAAGGDPGAGAAAWIVATAVGVAAALPIAATTVGAESDGALDNASGVAAVVLAAERLPATLAVGVLLTSGEELGLAGARAWARAHPGGVGDTAAAPSPYVALNCDGVDDGGTLKAMTAGAGSRRVADAMHAAATANGVPLRVMRLLPGVLVDAVALADAGWQAATLSGGTLSTLLRIHRPADRATRLEGTGIARAAAVLARAAHALTRET